MIGLDSRSLASTHIDEMKNGIHPAHRSDMTSDIKARLSELRRDLRRSSFVLSATAPIIVKLPIVACGKTARVVQTPENLGFASSMDIEPLDLRKIANLTLEHYDRRADDFWTGTRDHDVSQNIAALLGHIRGRPPFTILDFGCGPGRDLKTFTDLGHVSIGLEGSARFVGMAREKGYEVLQQNFLELDLPSKKFDGVFANASLFHVPSQELPRVLRELRAALKPGGVLFSSNPRGNNEEGWNRGRYGVYHDFETWRGFMLNSGFQELTHYYRPDGLPRDQQPWLASVWRTSANNA